MDNSMDNQMESRLGRYGSLNRIGLPTIGAPVLRSHSKDCSAWGLYGVPYLWKLPYLA